MATEPPSICADCGAPIEWDPIKDRWGSKIMDNAHTTAWSFTCRITRDPYDGHITHADYHHP